MQRKDVVIHFIDLFKPPNINWGIQMRLAETLLKKYSFAEIVFAISYYKSKGESLYSLGYLTYNGFSKMQTAAKEYAAEQYKTMQDGDKSGERNREKIKRNCESYNGKNFAEYLFTTSGDDD